MDLSIVVTSYNYEKYLKSSIESCLDQETSYLYEIIIIDDGSTDSSKTILKNYSSTCKIIMLQNSGVEVAANLGVRKSIAPYFVRLDADDCFNKNFIEESMKCIVSQGVDFVYPNYSSIDQDNRNLNNSNLPEFCIKEIGERGDFLATGTIFNKKSFIEVGGYREEVKNCGLENYEVILKMLQTGKVGKLIKDNLFQYRIHSNNMSSTRRDSIISYGNEIAQRLKLKKYKTNKNHPYGLQLS